jgi:hypothetical protein
VVVGAEVDEVVVSIIVIVVGGVVVGVVGGAVVVVVGAVVVVFSGAVVVKEVDGGVVVVIVVTGVVTVVVVTAIIADGWLIVVYAVEDEIIEDEEITGEVGLPQLIKINIKVKKMLKVIPN